jgi:hypothetical protein
VRRVAREREREEERGRERMVNPRSHHPKHATWAWAWAYLEDELLLFVEELASDEGELLPLLKQARLVEAVVVEAVLAVLQVVDGLLQVLHLLLRLLPLRSHPPALCI